MPLDLKLKQTDRDDGFTLVEMLVVVSILGIVGAIFASSVIQAMRVDDRTRTRADAQYSVSLALEHLTKQVRVAAPLVSATASQLVVDVYPSGTTTRERYTFALSGGSLTEQLQLFSPATSTTATSTTTRTLASQLDGAGSGFVAYERSGVATAVAGKVASVDISLKRTTKSKPYSASTTVYLRNYTG